MNLKLINFYKLIKTSTEDIIEYPNKRIIEYQFLALLYYHNMIDNADRTILEQKNGKLNKVFYLFE